MIDLYQLGTIPMDQISGRITNLQNEKDSINEQLVSEQKCESAANKKKEFVGALSRIDQTFSSGSLEEKRLLVSTLIESIWIDRSTVDIKWRI